MKFSIIVPVYNAQHTLDRLMDSLLGQQGCADYEILLVDDGSPDASGRMCDAYAQRDPRVRALHQTNAGPSAARNLGLDAAQGAYVLFCDADDWIEPDTLAVIEAALPADLLIFGVYDDVYQDGRLAASTAWKLDARAYGDPQSLLMDFHALLTHNLLYSQCTKVYRRAILQRQDLRFNPALTMGEDISFNLAYFPHAQRTFVLPRSLYHYVHVAGGGSVSSVFFPGYYENVCQIRGQQVSLLKKWGAFHPENELALRNFFLGRVSAAIQNELADPQAGLAAQLRRVRAILASPEAQDAALGQPTGRFHRMLAGWIRRRQSRTALAFFRALRWAKRHAAGFVARRKGA
ncbi:MAG: glycosyltransferase family 2 protein [Christensenellales bacterium]|jgi:glycosyltransferase involved in cell wall biosynthesis